MNSKWEGDGSIVKIGNGNEERIDTPEDNETAPGLRVGLCDRDGLIGTAQSHLHSPHAQHHRI